VVCTTVQNILFSSFCAFIPGKTGFSWICH